MKLWLALSFQFRFPFPATLASHPALWRTWLQFHFHFYPTKEHFPPVTLNFNLWPWPANMTYTGSRWTFLPDMYLKRHVVGTLSSGHTDTHTHTHTADRLHYTATKVVRNKVKRRWRFDLAVARWSQSMKLTYTEPSLYFISLYFVTLFRYVTSYPSRLSFLPSMGW